MTYEEWSEELRHALEKRGVSKAETERACAFWREAFEDRTESGMGESEAVADLGNAEEAADAVVESLPPFRKSLLGLRQNKERTILVIVLLIIGAIVWVPLVFAAALVAVSIFLALWSAIGCVWLADGAAMLSGITGVVALIWGCTQGYLAAGLAEGGVMVAVGGASVMLIPLAIQLTSILYHLQARFVRWIAHFFMRVVNPEAAIEEKASTLWWRRHPDTFRLLLTIGGIICAAGALLALIGFAVSGADTAVFSALPAIGPSTFGTFSLRF